MSQDNDVTLRQFPYPYRAALTLCSDIDGTHTAEHFLAIQDYLCSTRQTPMGPGLGLEIGNSFYAFVPDDKFAYHSSRPYDRHIIETMIRAGFIDCIHAFGEGASTRPDALRTLNALERAGCKLDVWTDHFRTSFNLGKDTTAGCGDDPASPAYHLDQTYAFGIKFVWRGRGSSLLCHGTGLRPEHFLSLYERDHPIATVKLIGREIVRTAAAYAGSRRFALHRSAALMRPVRLMDGHLFFEFQRSNPYWGGISKGHSSTELAYILRPEALSKQIHQGGTSIIYTHLGLGSAPPSYLPPPTRRALRDLAAAYYSGDIYVTTTSRLLNYSVYRDHLCWKAILDTHYRIEITGVADPVSGWQQPTIKQLQGLTFYVPDSSRAEVYLYGRQLTSITRNAPDHTGQPSVMIPRVALDYPHLRPLQ
ncbi:MAG: hypothetical protein ACOCX5_01165 [Chloroflexota bacterium]